MRIPGVAVRQFRGALLVLRSDADARLGTVTNQFISIFTFVV
jgi:hypothetical protein